MRNAGRQDCRTQNGPFGGMGMGTRGEGGEETDKVVVVHEERYGAPRIMIDFCLSPDYVARLQPR